MEMLILSIFSAVCVVSFVFSLIALKAADPLELRRISASVSGTTTELRNKLKDLEDVAIPRMEAHAEAILERAELRFDGAEAKRKSIAARSQHMGGADIGPGNGADWLDENLPVAARKAAIERAYRGR